MNLTNERDFLRRLKAYGDIPEKALGQKVKPSKLMSGPIYVKGKVFHKPNKFFVGSAVTVTNKYERATRKNNSIFVIHPNSDFYLAKVRNHYNRGMRILAIGKGGTNLVLLPFLADVSEPHLRAIWNNLCTAYCKEEYCSQD